MQVNIFALKVFLIAFIFSVTPVFHVFAQGLFSDALQNFVNNFSSEDRAQFDALSETEKQNFLTQTEPVSQGIQTEQTETGTPVFTHDQTRTSVIKTGTKALINTVIQKKDGLPQKVGVVLQVYAMRDSRLVPMDEVSVSEIELRNEEAIQFGYEIPSFIGSGMFLASFRILDGSSGMPLEDFLPIGEFEVLASENLKAVATPPIDGVACNLIINGDKERLYNLFEGPDIAFNEKLTLSCDTEGSQLSGTYTAHYNSVLRKFGSNASDEINFLTKEVVIKDDVLSFDIEHQDIPQAYDYVFYLSDEKNQRITPYIHAHYVIQGGAATIHSIESRNATDTEYYSVDVEITGAASNFPGSRAGSVQDSVNVFLELYDLETGEVSARTNSSGSLGGDLKLFSLLVPAKDVSNDEYRGVIRILDSENSNLLNQKEFTFKKPIAPEVEKSIAEYVSQRDYTTLGYTLVGLVLLILLSFALRNRNDLSTWVKWLILAALVCSSLSVGWLYFKQVVEAYTGCGGFLAGGVGGVPGSCRAVTVDNNPFATAVVVKTYIEPVYNTQPFQQTIITQNASNIYFSISALHVAYLVQVCTNGAIAEVPFNIYVNFSLNGTSFWNGTAVTNDTTEKLAYWGAAASSIYIPKSSLVLGNNVIAASYDYYQNRLSPNGENAIHFFNIPKLADAQCGYSSNRNDFWDKPTSNLCAIGVPSAVGDNMDAIDMASQYWIWTCTSANVVTCGANPVPPELIINGVSSKSANPQVTVASGGKLTFQYKTNYMPFLRDIIGKGIDGDSLLMYGNWPMTYNPAGVPSPSGFADLPVTGEVGGDYRFLVQYNGEGTLFGSSNTIRVNVVGEPVTYSCSPKPGSAVFYPETSYPLNNTTYLFADTTSVYSVSNTATKCEYHCVYPTDYWNSTTNTCTAKPQCMDQLDNDGDGKIDFTGKENGAWVWDDDSYGDIWVSAPSTPMDPECSSLTDDDETGASVNVWFGQ